MSKLVLVAECLAVFLFALAAMSVCSYNSIVKQFDVQPLLNDEDSLTTLRTDMDDDLECLYPTDCHDVKTCGRKKSGVFKVFPFGIGDGFLVYCDMKSEGGGWLVFQRRQDGSVDFYRNWKNYTDGFGNLHGEFWLGLEKMHLLTSQRRYELLINLVSYDGKPRHIHALYDTFYISDASQTFRILVGAYRGNAGDALKYHNGHKFSTYDEDNNPHSINCAVDRHGAWWYDKCAECNLNGQYYFTTQKTKTDLKSVNWATRKPMQFIDMKVRPFL